VSDSDKHSSLILNEINCSCKRFDSAGIRGQFKKLTLSVFYGIKPAGLFFLDKDLPCEALSRGRKGLPDTNTLAYYSKLSVTLLSY
jgi:hypothetical protein